MTDVRLNGLQCPHCRVDLMMSERQGVEVDYCPQCRGIWLDRGELDKILERAASYEAQASRPHSAVPAQPPVSAGAWGQGAPSSGHDGHRGKRHKSFLESFFD